MGRFAQCLVAVLLTACTAVPQEPEPPPSEPDEYVGTAVWWTDSTEWLVHVFKTGVLVSDEYSVPNPYHIPTHEEAQTLKSVTYGASGQRYLTDDGYTFGMPSASVTKAGSKTKYSVLGLYIRPTIIVVPF